MSGTEFFLRKTQIWNSELFLAYSDAYILECMKKDLKIWNESQGDVKMKEMVQPNSKGNNTELWDERSQVSKKTKLKIEKSDMDTCIQ